MSTCTQTETTTNKLSEISTNTFETLLITSQQETKDNDHDSTISSAHLMLINWIKRSYTPSPLRVGS